MVDNLCSIIDKNLSPTYLEFNCMHIFNSKLRFRQVTTFLVLTTCLGLARIFIMNWSFILTFGMLIYSCEIQLMYSYYLFYFIEKFGFIFQRNSHGSMREKLKMSERSRDRENEGGRDKERDWDREKERDSSRLGRKERGQDREKERNRDRRRDYERGRITNDERGRDKFDEWDRFHNRDNDRYV